MGFSQLLIDWYRANKRDLPWRYTSDPYKIWVSEVILQQTRVAQGLGYYLNFVETFPDLKSLADADIDLILKVWQGLGYYTRARNMHSTAQYISNELNGVFPDSYQELIKLRGIGDYTAAAIAAFAFNEPVAAVDGNVYRIFARFFGIETPIDTTGGKKELKAVAQSMVDVSRPGIYNQAIMDFGGTVCTPKRPNCYECPVMELCVAFRNRTVDLLPIKCKKVKQTVRYFSYVIPVSNGKTFIGKRIGNDIWHSLYEFPLVETTSECSIDELVRSEGWKNLFGEQLAEILHVSGTTKYVLSHQKIFARFVVVSLGHSQNVEVKGYTSVEFEKIEGYSTPRLIEGYLAAEPVEKYFKKNDEKV